MMDPIPAAVLPVAVIGAGPTGLAERRLPFVVLEAGTGAAASVRQWGHVRLFSPWRYGRAPTFLLATGYEQARSVVAALAGDWGSAREVRLELPETGVCSATLGVRAIAESFGLAPDVPAKLIAAATRHLPARPSAADAVLAAAAELGIESAAALRLAAFTSEQFGEAPVAAVPRGATR